MLVYAGNNKGEVYIYEIANLLAAAAQESGIDIKPILTLVDMILPKPIELSPETSHVIR
jgi:hypothetical protein